ncbi:MAG TPA: type II CAAX endopeptidase family protein, partial [Gemmatimonadaceae bacterium]
MSITRPVLALASIGLICAAVALWLFPRALPTLALDQRMSRQLALQRADSFFRAHEMAGNASRTAVRFETNDSLMIFVELAAGGKDTLDALIRSHDLPIFSWAVRAFTPGEQHEARVRFGTDGRVVGFRRVIPDAEERPEVDADSAEALARTVLAQWIDEDLSRWRRVATSYETRAPSGRVDRTITFERTDRRVGDAPIRLRVVVAGDTPIEAQPYVVIPETFTRRYGEMRSANTLLELLATVGMLGIALFGAVSLRRFARGMLRWRPAMMVGAVIGVLVAGTVLNSLPSSWYDYDTATSPGVFQAGLIAIALVGGAATFVLVALTLAAGEALTRRAFPSHLDWWQLWRARGTREVAWSVSGGYVVAAFAFAYVAVFYVVTRGLFGWWVPSALLDDPNQIATPLPWLPGLALSVQAAVWEEALFRAIPLAALSLWVGDRPTRGWWMAAGVVVTALIFGFAHAGYPSWPPYSRGVEIFLDACLWAVLFLRFGLLVTVVAHFTYDLVLFGLFAAAGTGLQYRVTAAVTLLALLTPALAVVWRWLRQGGAVALPPDARFGAWAPSPAPVQRTTPIPVVRLPLPLRGARLAVAAAAAASLVALLASRPDPLGAEFTASRDEVRIAADSALRARGVDPASWVRLVDVATEPNAAWRRFLRQHDATERAAELAETYAVPAWWTVRYVRTEDSLAARAEEWRVRLFPDGRLLDVRHIVPEEAPGGTPSNDEARRTALTALVQHGIDTATLEESQLTEAVRPQRRDVTITYVDTTVSLPAGAQARVTVTLAGHNVLLVRRSVHLPEDFLRADRRRSQGALALAVASGMIAVVIVVIVAVRVVRRRPALVHDRLARRTAAALIVLLVAVHAGASLQELPSLLFQYDTTVPWSRFLGQTGVATSMSLLSVLVLVALWM